MPKRERVVVGAIAGVALAVRLAWCVTVARASAGLHDPGLYVLFGDQLANGNGYRLPGGVATAYYPPGYSLSLAPFFWLAQHTPLDRIANVEVGVVAALNIVWQLATVVLAFVIARRVSGRVAAGYVAAAALALWPNLVFHTAVALTESLFGFLLLVVVLLVVTAPWDAGGWERWRLVAVGAVLGAATLVRPVTVPVFPAIAVVLLVSRCGWRRALAQAAAVTGVAAAVLLPWALRNAGVMDQLTLSTNTGDNLCMSRYVGGTGGFELPNTRCLSGPFDDLDRPAFETERDAYGRRLAFEFVRDHPAEEIRLVFRRLGATFTDDADGIAAVESYGDDRFLSSSVRDGLRTVATAYGFVVGLLAGGAGLVLLAWRRRPAPLFVVLTALGMLVPPALFFGDPRFHVPAVPLAAIAAGCLVSDAWSRAAGRRGSVRQLASCDSSWM